VKTHRGPIAIRYPRGAGAEELYSHMEFLPGKAEMACEGDALCIITIGSMVEVALEVSKYLQAEGISCAVMNCRSMKPIDQEAIIGVAKKTGRIVVLEDNCLVGGLSSAVLDVFSTANCNPEILRLGYPDACIVHGSKCDVSKHYQMDAEGVFAKIMETWGDRLGKGTH